jgi:hypothetical protein
VEQAAETVAALDAAGWRGDHVSGAIGRAQAEPLVRSGLVVVASELGEDLFQVTPTEDQQVVEQLAARGANPALGERVRTRRPVGQADDLDALAAEDFIEGSGELGVPVTEQELGGKVAILQLPGQVPSLLDDPFAGWVVGAAGEVKSATADLDDEEDVEPGQPDGIDGEEVCGDDLIGVRDAKQVSRGDSVVFDTVIVDETVRAIRSTC